MIRMQNDVDPEVEAFLVSPAAYGLSPGASVERIETHASLVFLAGERAWKLKKPVRYDYLDFSTLEKRRAACEHELELNRRTAPGIYLGVVPLRRTPEGFSIGGAEGGIVDWLVEMRRFEAEGLFARMAGEGRLTRAHIEALAARIADFHRHAAPLPDKGGAESFARILAGNDADLAAFAGEVFDASHLRMLHGAGAALLARDGYLLDQRRAQGWVRLCHGDLHLGNVTLIGGEPVIFDCIEFNDDIASIDILYDLAFLLMDLAVRARADTRLQGFANRALNAYLDHTDGQGIGAALDGLALIRLFMATRAAVRAKVTALLAAQGGKREEARGYLEAALDMLRAPRPRLIAIGGLSGTGKSTLAAALAPHAGGVLGAVHLRSDIVRKRLWGVEPLSRLPAEAYGAETGARVYDGMLTLAARALAAGVPVVLDAVFARPGEREAAEELAAAMEVPFLGLWLEAPSPILEGRIAAREEQGADPSDATVEVLHRQLAYDIGPMRWTRLDASQSGTHMLERALQCLASPH